ncbi:hypothetical protein PV10_02890 [Exophiala mesophila]|uniref:Uncharacterized protein n=1 Tax=Exophiala mesophila TaxID=212818 RepID=A0A0D1Y3J3_EXOME|nr:uncharacterized protein PV10_02890 [Exophiala mesophila]KIV95211.1 hypothetical protein PV10_02890 [Exophiala mesophila]
MTENTPPGEPTLRIVHKSQYDRQIFIPAPESNLPQLAPSSVRVQSRLIGLTANNLSYCALGTALHWWDAFPLPSWAEVPSNDASEYGVSPGWGYAMILESNVPSLQAGSLLWGFIPVSTCPVDLLLTQSKGLSSHYIEVSQHRSQVMPLYQRYIAVGNDVDLTSPVAGLTAMLKPVFEASFLYNTYNFPSDPSLPVLHPGIGHSWGPEDADLTHAAVICLGAGSKTSRSFVHQLATNRAKGSGPLAVLEISSSPSPFSGRNLPFAHKAVRYEELQGQQASALSEWLVSHAGTVKRFVLFDFASRRGTTQVVYDLLRSHSSGLPVEVLMVGSAPQVYSAQELGERQDLTTRLNAVRCNASGIRVAAMEAEGEEAFFNRLDAAFDDLVQEGKSHDDGKYVGIDLVSRHGLQGSQGLEGTWNLLCDQKLRGDQGFAFLL